jgi:hypothetical protein
MTDNKKGGGLKVIEAVDFLLSQSLNELALKLCIESLKLGNTHNHQIALKAFNIHGLFSIEDSLESELLDVFTSIELPVYLQVALAKRILLRKKAKQCSEISVELGFLYKVQNREAEKALSLLFGTNFTFPKIYDLVKDPAPEVVSKPEPFLPGNHHQLGSKVGFLLERAIDRCEIRYLSYRHKRFFFYYSEGERVIVDSDGKVCVGSDSSNYIYKSFLENFKSEETKYRHFGVLLNVTNYTPARNFCHWLTDYFPYILYFSKRLNEEFHVTFSEPLAEYQLQTLETIPNCKVVRLSNKEIIEADCVYTFDFDFDYKHPLNYADPHLLKLMQEHFVQKAPDTIVNK